MERTGLARPASETTLVAALLDRMLDGCALYVPTREAGRIVDFERVHLNPAGIRRMASQGIDVRLTSLRAAAPGIERQGIFRRYVDVVETQRAWSGEDVTYRDGTVSGIYDIQAWPVGEGFAVTWREVTDRERVLEALRHSEQRFRATVDQLPDAVSVFESVRDRNGRIADFRWVYCNRYNAEMTGYPVERLLGARLLEIFPEQGPAGMIDVYSEVVASGASWQQPTVWYEDTWGDGTRRRRAFDVRASKVGDGFVVVSRDVTDLRLATEALRAKERQLDEAQHLASLGSWEHDLVTGETDWSEECRDILAPAPTPRTPGASTACWTGPSTGAGPTTSPTGSCTRAARSATSTPGAGSRSTAPAPRRTCGGRCWTRPTSSGSPTRSSRATCAWRRAARASATCSGWWATTSGTRCRSQWASSA